MDKHTQQKRILKHLTAGLPLTRVEALLRLRIANPTARISELRRQGHNITRSWQHGKGPEGEPIKWAVYRMEQ